MKADSLQRKCYQTKNPGHLASSYDNKPQLNKGQWLMSPFSGQIGRRIRRTRQQVGQKIFSNQFRKGKPFVRLFRYQVDGVLMVIKKVSLKKMRERQQVNSVNFLIKKEIYILKNLKSKYCVGYFAIQLDQDNMNIYMQDCQGWKSFNSLEDYMDVYNPNSQKYYYLTKNIRQWEFKNIQIMTQLLLGLADLIKIKLIHKDIKPSNIVFKSNGSIRLIDFDNSQFYYRQYCQKCGTWIYKPSQLQIQPLNINEICPLKIDGWSIGLIVYELFNRRKYQSSPQKYPIWPYDMYALDYNRKKNKQNLYIQINRKIIVQQEGLNISKLKHAYIPLQVQTKQLKPIVGLIERLLEIDNEKRYSFEQFYSDNRFDQLFKQLKKVQQNKQNKQIFIFKGQHKSVAQLLMCKVVYQQANQILKSISQNENKYRDLAQEYLKSKNGNFVDNLPQIIKNLQLKSSIQINTKITNQNDTLDFKLKRIYKILAQMNRLYKDSYLYNHPLQLEVDSYNLIRRLIPDLRILYRKRFGVTLPELKMENVIKPTDRERQSYLIWKAKAKMHHTITSQINQ